MADDSTNTEVSVLGSYSTTTLILSKAVEQASTTVALNHQWWLAQAIVRDFESCNAKMCEKV